jgi:hypothetical protein
MRSQNFSSKRLSVDSLKGAREMRLDVTDRPKALHVGRRDPGGAGRRAATPPPQMGRRCQRLLHRLLRAGNRPRF